MPILKKVQLALFICLALFAVKSFAYDPSREAQSRIYPPSPSDVISDSRERTEIAEVDTEVDFNATVQEIQNNQNRRFRNEGEL